MSEAHVTPTHRTEGWVLDATDGRCPECLIEEIDRLKAEIASLKKPEPAPRMAIGMEHEEHSKICGTFSRAGVCQRNRGHSGEHTWIRWPGLS